ncbi:MAG: D-alanyl-D-alanine carboxypeptidase/D-alanyl-D-alanine-endopeptidase [Frankiales bacterium]|nr:D-alanyl-D-alanine carboxypeptidase/D-alanyl-D-alanine-endopeptidase [Frankiales bacterium]
MPRRSLLLRVVGVPVLAALAGVVGASPAYAATTQQEAAAFATALSSTSAQVTAGVLDDTGASLAAVNATSALPPASTEKIATVGAALKVFGPAHRFTTVLQGTRPLPRRAIWQGLRQPAYGGPMVVVGGGDPSLRAAGLTTLLSPIPHAGVTSIRGGLWLDVSLFDAVRTAPGWKSEWLGTEVGPLSAFMYEQNLTRTDAAYLQDPNTGNLSIVSAWLKAHGVTVYGGLHVGRPSGVLQTLATVSSQPLSVLGTTTLQDSVNTWAEMLLKDVGASDGEGSTRHGLQVVRTLVGAVGGDLGVAYDGSGLSQLDSKTAVQELGTVRGLGTSPIGPALLAELPVSCTNGTLKQRLCNLTGRVHAKTGTVTSVSALTGYVIDASGVRLWFSVQVQGGLSTSSRQALIDRAVTALAG